MNLRRSFGFFRVITSIFNLRKDCDETGTVENIRKNVDFHGANAWTLVFAIFIASIGLNMNSGAVIIGAMLISPLMGPILGVGLALGINDEELLKKSFRNLGIAVLISVGTSMAYFLISPIHDVRSELLARTYPTFYDVLIAFFGGAAGIVSISRKERGPSVAGVAIATALMPPLCTAGFAISEGNLKFLAGALYLFLINSVFISLSTLLFVRYMKFKVIQYQEHEEKKKIRGWIGVVVVLIILPSLFFAWTLLEESRFNLRAEKFIKEQVQSDKIFVVNQNLKFSYRQPSIQLSLIGKKLSESEIRELELKMPFYHLQNSRLELMQIDSTEKVPSNTPLEAEVNRYKQLQSNNEADRALINRVSEEARLLFPGLDIVVSLDDKLGVIWGKQPQKNEIEKINSYLQVRLDKANGTPEHLVRYDVKTSGWKKKK